MIPRLLIRTLRKSERRFGGVYWHTEAYNHLRIALTLFSDERFRDVMKAYLASPDYTLHMPRALQMLLDSDSRERRDELRKRFKRSDDEIIAMWDTYWGVIV